MGRRLAAWLLPTLAIWLGAGSAMADPVTTPITEGAREQSCKALAASTVGFPEDTSQDQDTGSLKALPPATGGLLPAAVYLRTRHETFNRRYSFAVRRATIFAQPRTGSDHTWHHLVVPPCFDGRVKSISVDDDEMIALDGSRRIFTMDNALKDASLWNWSSRWGTPFWTGQGYNLPSGIVAWAWSVVSPSEDGRWTDPAGNHTAIGGGKVSHIWALRRGGRRINFWDPWLPTDESYQMCGPIRGRFKAVNLSASGSTIFVIGPRGDLFTRIYDFDLSGHDKFFFHYSYENQRGKGDGAPIQLPAARWVHQPKIPGRITSAISIHKVGRDVVHRIMRVEGFDFAGGSGYWEKDIVSRSAGAWRFHPTGVPLGGTRLPNPQHDTSRIGLGHGDGIRFAGRGSGVRLEVRGFDTYCSPARLIVHPAKGRAFQLVLHNVDGLRQEVRARGLDGVPREQYGNIEVPRALLHRPFVRSVLGGRRFTDVTLEVTSGRLQVQELGWSLKRVKK
jgi:hypothetical protein